MLKQTAIMIHFLLIMGLVQLARRTGALALQYDSQAAVDVILFGRVIHHWEPTEFIGWGHPLAPLFTTHGEWMKHDLE